MLALIIWGSSSSEKVLGEGMFGCPNCRNTVPFAHKKLQRYFTLYFIPLFPIGTIAEYVECQQCRGKFQPAILQHMPQMPQQGGWPQQGGPPQGGWPQQGGPPQGGWPPQGGPPQGGQGWGP